METPLNVPNLPDSDVITAVTADSPDTVNALKALGIRVLSPERSSFLPDETSVHTDMLLCHAGGKDVFLAPDQQELRSALEKLGFNVTICAAPEPEYPKDVKLNVLVSGTFFSGRLDCVDADLRDTLVSKGKKPVNVKQGYAKCSVCPVAENAFITDDAGTAGILKKLGADVLLISKGEIYLSEAHCGFIGGAAGKISKNRLAFNGSLNYHSDGKTIRAFLKKYGVTPVELSGSILRDVGGIIPLTQKYSR